MSGAGHLRARETELTSQPPPSLVFPAGARSIRVTIVKSDSGEIVRELAINGVVEITFSPKGTYLSTWERYGQSSSRPLAPQTNALPAVGSRYSLLIPFFPRTTVKPEDPNAQHTNLRIFSTASGEEVMAFTNKSQENWSVQPSSPPPSDGSRRSTALSSRPSDTCVSLD